MGAFGPGDIVVPFFNTKFNVEHDYINSPLVQFWMAHLKKMGYCILVVPPEECAQYEDPLFEQYVHAYEKKHGCLYPQYYTDIVRMNWVQAHREYNVLYLDNDVLITITAETFWRRYHRHYPCAMHVNPGTAFWSFQNAWDSFIPDYVSETMRLVKKDIELGLCRNIPVMDVDVMRLSERNVGHMLVNWLAQDFVHLSRGYFQNSSRIRMVDVDSFEAAQKFPLRAPLSKVYVRKEWKNQLLKFVKIRYDQIQPPTPWDIFMRDFDYDENVNGMLFLFY